MAEEKKLQPEDLDEMASIQMQRKEMESFSSGYEKPPIDTPVECDSTNTDVAGQSSLGRRLAGVQESGFDSGKSATSMPTLDASTHLHSPPPSYYNQPEGSWSSDQSTNLEKKDEVNLVATYGMGRPSDDYMSMPLKKLRYETRRQLGLHLDPDRPTVPNWKSVADYLGFSNLQIQNFEQDRYKTQAVLNECEVRQPNLTVGDLCKILQELGRLDVITDLQECFERDYKEPPLNSLVSARFDQSPAPSYRTVEPLQECAVSSTFYDHQQKTDIPPHLPEERYDAFVLYNIADKDFILKEFLPKVEVDAQIKLFLPERDLTAGVQSYHAKLNTMIGRCSKLIIILSNEFLTSPESQWALNMGVSLDPASRMQKIIPVIYKTITEPNILGGYNACDRTRVLEDSWFWNNVIKSLKRGRV
uniref:Myeloid differentiation primary response protein MyD88 n=1 Tax=Phallusia mammillata TaxID=59560 RepID=A0A6F9DKY1_9ASCI|nr:myeloid differentiation primary response protein MyD88 [Phallusia mammillata]